MTIKLKKVNDYVTKVIYFLLAREQQRGQPLAFVKPLDNAAFTALGAVVCFPKLILLAVGILGHPDL